MTELLTAAQMKAIEQAAIDSGQVTGLELMERAGRGVVDAVFEEWPELAKTSHYAVVLCGPGNNGGDGFVVARLLKEWGWEVEVFLYGDAEALPPDAKVNYLRWLEVGEVEPCWVPEECIIMASLVVDAIFGAGLSRPIPSEVYTAINDCNYFEVRLVCIDAISGLCLDSGRYISEVNAPVPVANLTVTFQRPRIGHWLNCGSVCSGRLIVADIELEHQFTRFWTENVVKYSPLRVERCSLGSWRVNKKELPRGDWATTLDKSSETHKYSHGHALILSGPSGKTGAARLAARGALRIGAGVVTVGCPPEAVAENAAQLNAIMLEAVHDGDALAQVLQDTRINALCLGPGLGAERARELVPVAMASKAHIVLDADALTAFSDDPETLFELTSSHRSVVLTPHVGEFSRLFPDIAKRLSKEPMSGPAFSKVDATREAAKRAGCVVLFKGADTVIADADGRAAINSAHYDRAAPWLATAGSGDVLAGFITGLLARGFAPMQAAETAAWLHVECALNFGPGLIAEDLPEALPAVLQQLDC